MSRVIALIGPLFLLSCVSAPKVKEPAREISSIERAPNRANPLIKTLFVSKIENPQTFDDLAEESTGVVRQGKVIKAFIDNRVNGKPVVYFMNANYCPKSSCSEPPPEAVFHYNFGKAALRNFAVSNPDYLKIAYTTTTLGERKFFDARIQRFHLTVNGQDTTYYGIRFIERDVINNELVKYAVEAIAKVLQIPQQNVAFIVNSDVQKIDELKPWFEARKISTFTMENILSGIDYIGLNPGVAYGFLKVFPKDENGLEPFDIPVFDSLPLDLGVVAGTLSTEFQDAGSHVNLKAKERNTPNAVIRKPSDIDRIKGLNGMPVKLTVAFDHHTIEEVSKETVFAEYEKKLPKKWIPVTQVDENRLAQFDDLCKGQAPGECLKRSRSYGGKVAGLGFLAHANVTGMGSPVQKKFGYRLTPMGFGVPLAYYNRFMDENYKKNPKLAGFYDKLINSEMGMNGAQPMQNAERQQVIKDLQTEILHGEIPADFYQATYAELMNLKKKVDVFYPGTSLEKIKIRSSSNAEDIPGFNGAGLHDSYSARISKSTPDDFKSPDCKYEPSTDDDTGLTEEDVKPKSLACAIKGTYASLWNLRAVRERTYKRFDHRTASMGLSVQVAYKFRKGSSIKSNAVLVTRVLGTESVYGQQLSTQVGNGLVTNPLPNTKAELAVISFDVAGNNFGINLLQYAKPEANQPVLDHMVNTRPEMLQMSEIARATEVEYCKAVPNYYPGGNCKAVTNSAKKALALDMEFKQFDSGEFMIKQVRTFSGR